MILDIYRHLCEKNIILYVANYLHYDHDFSLWVKMNNDDISYRKSSIECISVIPHDVF